MKKALSLPLLLLLPLALTPLAHASDWKEYPEKMDAEKKVFIDQDSIQSTEGVIAFNLKFVFLPESEMRQKYQIAENRSVMKINCKDNTLQPSEAAYFDTNGQQVSESEKISSWMPIQPNTNGEWLTSLLCPKP